MHAAVDTLLSSCEHAVTMGWQDAWSTIDYGIGYGGRDITGQIAPIAVVFLTFAGFLGFVWIRAWARVREKRLDVIRELSEKGQISPQTAERHLLPQSWLKSAVYVAAWFGLLGGAAMVVVGIANEWRYDFAELGAAGIAVFLLSLATLTAPMALAEIRRHTAS